MQGGSTGCPEIRSYKKKQRKTEVGTFDCLRWINFTFVTRKVSLCPDPAQTALTVTVWLLHAALDTRPQGERADSLHLQSKCHEEKIIKSSTHINHFYSK